MKKIIPLLLIAAATVVAVIEAATTNTTTSAGESNTIVLPYNAFGPQAMAHQIIGFGWYQWRCSGCGYLNAPADDVRVVVYRGITREETIRRYPVVMNEQDYRYLSYEDAVAYLVEQEREATEIRLTEVAARLKATREQILGELSGPSRTWPVATPGSVWSGYGL